MKPNKTRKKAQISIFIILGIIILMVFGLLFYLAYLQIESDETKEDSIDVKNFINNCLSSSVEKEIQLLAMKGGYYNPAEKVDIENAEITVLKKSNSNLCPNIKQIEDQLEANIKPRFLECMIESKEIFKGKDIDYGQPIFNVAAYPSNIFISMTFPVKISAKGYFKEEKDFNYDQKGMRLPYIILIINESITQMIEEENYFNEALFNNTNLNINITKYETGVLFEISDHTSRINGEPLEFVYAVEY